MRLRSIFRAALVAASLVHVCGSAHAQGGPGPYQNSQTITQLSGDVTGTGPGITPTTLATVNSNVGTCGDATHVSQVTLDQKGRVTACTPVAITSTAGTITALAGDVTASGSGVVTAVLATVNSNVGTCGDATHVSQVTLDQKGRVTACTPVAITSTAGTITALAGDVTTSGSGVVTAVLATVNSSPGTVGDASHVPTVTVNGKGLVTGGSPTTIAILHSQITDWASTLSSYELASALGPLATQAAVTSAHLVGTGAGGLLVPSSVTSGDVTGALGFAPLSATSPLPAANLTGTAPSGVLPIMTPTTAGVASYDNTVFSLTSGKLGCATCLTPDAVTTGNINNYISVLNDGPVCSNIGYFGENNPTTAGQQVVVRTILYCPNGAKSVRFLLSAAYVNTSSTPPLEVVGTNPVLWNLSVEPNVPPPWNSATAYAINACVSTAPTSAGNPEYCALVANTNSMPTPSNTNWAASAGQTVEPVTCNGTRPCVLHTNVTIAGTLMTDGIVETDPIPVNVAAGGFIALRGYSPLSAGQITGAGPYQRPTMGSYYKTSSSALTDITLTGNYVVASTPETTAAFAAIGQQPSGSTVPSVCIIGNAAATGFSGSGLYSLALTAGGSGYGTSDVGLLLALPNTGMSTGDAMVGASVIIQAVSGGAVTQVGVFDPGHYAATGTLPSGAQTVVGGAGSGLQVTPTFSGGAGVYNASATLSPGGIGSGLSAAGIPWVAFTHYGDTAASWVAQGGAQARLAAVAKTGCTSAIVQLGLNDFSTLTAAQTKAALVTLGNELLGLGTIKAVYLATMPPNTSTTDSWATVGNQTVQGNNASRISVDDWERTVPTPYSGAIDLASGLEVNSSNALTTDGGFWITSASTLFYATADGTQPSPVGYQTEAATVQSFAASPGFK